MSTVRKNGGGDIWGRCVRFRVKEEFSSGMLQHGAVGRKKIFGIADGTERITITFDGGTVYDLGVDVVQTDTRAHIHTHAAGISLSKNRTHPNIPVFHRVVAQCPRSFQVSPCTLLA